MPCLIKLMSRTIIAACFCLVCCRPSWVASSKDAWKESSRMLELGLLAARSGDQCRVMRCLLSSCWRWHRSADCALLLPSKTLEHTDGTDHSMSHIQPSCLRDKINANAAVNLEIMQFIEKSQDSCSEIQSYLSSK